ncbi:glycosyltransferase family 8 protein, partial [Campylobacter coli]|nr:glycosyltransferase family 8 protein [Campylobacter coli]
MNTEKNNTNLLENTHFQDKDTKPYFKEKIAIVFSVDENYINYLCVALQSLKAHSTSEHNYDIIILYTNLNAYKIQIFMEHFSSKNFKIRFLDMKDILKLFDNKLFYLHDGHGDQFTIATYYRFFIPDLFFEFDKVVYCDCDAVFLDDVAKLYNINLEDKILAAVKDIEIQRTHLLKDNKRAMDYITYLKNTLKLKNSKDYFQAGFLIFNIQRCLEFKLLKQCIRTLNKVKNPLYQDQDILNKVVEGNVKFLDFTWNVENHIMVFDFFYTLNDELYKIYKNSLDNAKFLHYSGSKKPWLHPQTYNAHIWWHYARQTPFYEEILFKNIKDNVLKNLPSNHVNLIHVKPCGAVEKVKSHLSFKLGKEILSIKENKLKILALPFTLIFITIKHKISNSIYKLILNS